MAEARLDRLAGPETDSGNTTKIATRENHATHE
jgi:hypothetical protein